MIVLILILAFITFFILYGFYSDTMSRKNSGKVWIVSIAIFIIIWCAMVFISKYDIGFGFGYRHDFHWYEVEWFIFDDHWFLSSLTLGSFFFFIGALIELNSKRKRAIMLSNETAEERQLREEKEAKECEQAQEKLRIYRSQQAEKQRLQTASAQSYTELKCPKCGSTNLTANNKGFGLGKAAVGGVLLGPVGLLGGLVGSKKPVFICLKCGNQFQKQGD